MALAFLLAMSLAAQVPMPETWKQADADTRRLPPSGFPELSAPLRTELDRRGCTIPQVYTGGPPHNVVRGRFGAVTTLDVAVLCSRERTSTIIVFWNGDPDSASEIAAFPDATFLQVAAPGQIGFSRLIATASPESIREQHRRYGGVTPPPLVHDGINDLFVDKASVVWYWHEGTWLRLTGAD